MRSVLVTGGSSGIGRAAALRFAARGDRLALLARSATALADTAAQCREAGSPRVTTLVADVADRDAVDAAVDSAVDDLDEIDVCVHAAAVAAYGRLLDVPGEVYDRVVDVNVKGTVNVARATLRHFEPRRAGTLILLGSLIGRIGTPYLSAYGGTKWAVRGLARSWHAETLAMPGVHVCEVWPGAVNTPVYEQAATYAGREARPPPPVVSADRVAAAVLTVADRPRPRVGVGWGNPLMLTGFTALPWVYDRLVGPLMLRLGLSGRSSPPTPGNLFDPPPGGERVDGPWHGWLGVRS